RRRGLGTGLPGSETKPRPRTTSRGCGKGHRGINPIMPVPTAPGQPRGRSAAPGDTIVDPLETALALRSRGLWPVAIYPAGEKVWGRDRESARGKEPSGKAWGAEPWTEARLRREFGRHPGAGVGLCIGPGRGPDGAWLIDVESDGDGHEESRAALFGGEVVESAGWRSARGPHQLLTVDGERLGAILAGLKGCERQDRPGVYHLPNLPGLALRLGG